MSARPGRATLVLASSSPRRLELLRQVGFPPDLVLAPEVDETPLPRELPRDYARRLARLKAEAVAARLDDGPWFVVAGDTVVAAGRRILPKAEDEATARACLERLSGRRHRVWGGVCVLRHDSRRSERVVLTRVRFKRLSREELEDYLASGEWRGKAGGYAIQGRAAAFVPWINGSCANVIGLPVAEVVAMLRGLGYRGGAP